MLDPQAPEVLMGEKCGTKVDMYSYGVVLWEVTCLLHTVVPSHQPTLLAISAWPRQRTNTNCNSTCSGVAAKHQAMLAARRTRTRCCNH